MDRVSAPAAPAPPPALGLTPAIGRILRGLSLHAAAAFAAVLALLGPLSGDYPAPETWLPVAIIGWIVACLGASTLSRRKGWTVLAMGCLVLALPATLFILWLGVGMQVFVLMSVITPRFWGEWWSLGADHSLAWLATAATAGAALVAGRRLRRAGHEEGGSLLLALGRGVAIAMLLVPVLHFILPFIMGLR